MPAFQRFLSPKCNRPGGGGCLIYLFDGDVPFFRVSFSPIFSRIGYQKKAILLDPLVKTCPKGNFLFII